MCMLSPELPTPREAFPDAFGLMETGAPVLVAEAGGARTGARGRCRGCCRRRGSP